MNRRRKHNRGLPRRVIVNHGAYYFFAPEPMRNPWTQKEQRWIRLCSFEEGEAVMYERLGFLMREKKLTSGTMPNLCEEWKQRKLARYTPAVRKEYERMADFIGEKLEEFTVADVKARTITIFLRKYFAEKHNTAQKYVAVLRKMFKMAISEMGLRDDNPCDQLDLSDYETKRRDVLPSHEIIAKIRAAALIGDDGLPTESGPMFQCIVDMAYLCWQRAIDVRMLRDAQIEGGAIRFKPTKTAKSSGKMVDIAITPSIDAVIERAEGIKRKYQIISPYLFPSTKGTPYTKSGLHSMWRRAKARAKVTEDVVFKDLRALGATDAARQGKDKKQIQTRLAHTSGRTSEIYIKEVIAERSEMDVALPWNPPNTETGN
ncbi:tyrosine-type recombinase/integrase [Caballeronia sp. LZ025]|uniref:tyrosine-type recombinase/integrase n=1 Tax=Caballeronia TaxID=1827195 RepID=UPI001FD58872|nr:MULTISPECIES: tyrosine-type recombinase/integrase [Caballeronia]MDR5736176.1 tyrosine-type recombinase/integrase [Caballeronia sp. LZ025]